MPNTAQDITFDDVRLTVDELVANGADIKALSLRQIRASLGDRGSFSTISKHLTTIKAEIASGDVPENGEVSDTDMAAVRKLLEEVVTRRTFHYRQDALAARTGAAEDIRHSEIANANLRDVIADLEGQNDVLLEASSSSTARIEELNALVARLEGKIEALNATLGTFASAAAKADAATASGKTVSPSRDRRAKMKNVSDHDHRSQAHLPLSATREDNSGNSGTRGPSAADREMLPRDATDPEMAERLNPNDSADQT